MSALPYLLLLVGPPAAAAAPRPQEVLTDRRRTPVVEVVERVKPAVVSISSGLRHWNPFLGGYVDSPGPSGTGVVIFEDGFIITNHHVVKDASNIVVRFDESDDATAYEASVVSVRPEEDLALLKIVGEEPFHTVTLCESEPILGEPVVAIGNAYGHSHTVSTGIVSGLHRDIETRERTMFSNLIQTDASINPGNSGGPLLNINGELIGINTAMQGMAENIGFAIPVSHVRKVLTEQLLALSEARAWLGFEVDERTLEVVSVAPDGPADRAGLHVGDRLVSLHRHLLAGPDGDASEIYRRVRLSIPPRETVEMTVRDGVGERQLLLDSMNKVDGMLFERLGLGLETVRIGARGGDSFLRVTQVYQPGPGRTAGLEPGDVITSVQREGRRAVWYQRPEDLAGLVSRLPSGTVLELKVWRDFNGNGLYFERDARRSYSEELEGPLTVR